MTADVMRAGEAGSARLLRRVDGRWEPVSVPLPPIDDDAMHPERLPRRGRDSYWHLPVDVDARPGDVLILREQAIQLKNRCAIGHPAVERLVAHVAADHGTAYAQEWISRRQVWSCEAVDLDWLRGDR